MPKGEQLSPVQEMPFPGINWGKNIYDPQTLDWMGAEMGVTRVLIDSTIYNIEEDNQGNPFMSRRAIDVDTNTTRIYIGRPATMPSISVTALSDSPFSLSDAERMNKSAELGQRLAEIDTAYLSSLRIQNEGMRFLREIRSFIPSADTESLEKIAVLGKALEQYTKRDYPEEFVNVAKEMTRLKIKEIGIAQKGSLFMAATLTADYLQKTYGESVEAA